MRDYEQTWESFWKGNCEFADGSINLDQIKRELHDYHTMMGSVSEVYMHISAGKLSKPNYDSSVMIAEHDARCQEAWNEGKADSRESNEP